MWQKICTVEHDLDLPDDWFSLWRSGSGLGLGFAVKMGDKMVELPVVELRKVLMDDLLWELIGKLYHMDGHEIMQILIEHKALDEGLSRGGDVEPKMFHGEVSQPTDSQRGKGTI